MTSADYLAPWVPGASYHIYNRAVTLNRLFVNWRNVAKFREVIALKLRPFFYLYCLSCVGNHFHMHAQLRSLEAIEGHLLRLRGKALLSRQRRYLAGEVELQELIGDAFARTFNAYATHFNIVHEREGGLFNRTVRRLRVREDKLSRRLCGYAHFNAHKHGLYRGHLGLRELSTYAEVANGTSALIDLERVYARFGGQAGFVDFHATYLGSHRRVDLDVDEDTCLGYVEYPERFAYELNRGECFRWVATPVGDRESSRLSGVAAPEGSGAVAAVASTHVGAAGGRACGLRVDPATGLLVGLPARVRACRVDALVPHRVGEPRAEVGRLLLM